VTGDADGPPAGGGTGDEAAGAPPGAPVQPPAVVDGDRATTASDGGPVTARQAAETLGELARDVADVERHDVAERRVCTRLVDSGLYAAAWIGVRALRDDGVTVRTCAGIDLQPHLTAPTDGDDPLTVTAGPWQSALESGSVAVADAASLDTAGWPAAEPPDAGTVAAAPVGDDAVLCVATPRTNALRALERSGFALLGRTLGLVAEAARARELFFADGATALELRVTDRASLLVGLSATHSCRLDLEGYAARGDAWRLVCDVEGADVTSLAAAIGDAPDVASARPIVDRTDGGRLELQVTAAPLIDRTVDVGASVGSAVADHGACRVTLELPRSGAVCETVASLRDPFPDLEFLSLREHDRQPDQPTASATLLDDLTDRQHEVLETAYDAGYFEWPRRHTAEEVAPDLGITSPTLHWHLREAERRLLAALLD
jgi:hypothetical protein